MEMFENDFETIWTYIKDEDEQLSREKYREIIE